MLDLSFTDVRERKGEGSVRRGGGKKLTSGLVLGAAIGEEVVWAALDITGEGRTRTVGWAALNITDGSRTRVVVWTTDVAVGVVGSGRWGVLSVDVLCLSDEVSLRIDEDLGVWIVAGGREV